MFLAVTLRLDDTAAAAVAVLARRLRDRPASYPPHLTLAVLPATVPEAAVLAAAALLARGWNPLPVSLASLGLFTRPKAVLFLAPVATPALLARQAALLDRLPHGAVQPHQQPGAWVPHVTLAEDLPDPQGALAALGLPDLPVAALLDRLEVVRFPPPRILASHALPLRTGAGCGRLPSEPNVNPP